MNEVKKTETIYDDLFGSGEAVQPAKEEESKYTPTLEGKEAVPEKNVEEESHDDEVPSDVDNPKSYKFFQSKFNKTDTELRKIAAEKEAIAAEKERLAKELEALKQPKVEPEKPLVKPVKPQKPANYDETDAYTDPSSVSFQYRVSHEQFRDDMIEYQNALVEKTSKALESTQGKLQQKEQDELVAQKYKAYQDKYVEEQSLKGVPKEKAEAIFKWVSTEESSNPDYWEALYDIAHGNKPNDKTNNLKNRGKKMDENPPPPIGGAKVHSEAPDEAQAAFEAIFKEDDKPLNKIF